MNKPMNARSDIRRSYDQFCPLARSLDFLGERWTLLIVRNLMIGPQRYKDLLDCLPGIATNLLAARLKELEKAGIVGRRKLPPPAGSTVYELSQLGRELEAALIPVMRWGMWTLREPRDTVHFRPAWGILGFKIVFRPEAAEGIRETYEWRVDGEAYHITVVDGVAEFAQGPAIRPDVVFTCDGETFMALASASLSAAEAFSGGRLKFEGSPAAVAHFARIFPAPTAT